MPIFPVLPDLALAALVAAAAATDLAARRIPNQLVGAGLLAALALHLINDAGRVPLIWLGGALTGFVLLLPLYLLRGMAAGDVKLMAMVGAFVGPAPALAVALATGLIGGLMALLIVLWRRRPGRLGGGARHRFGPRGAAAAAADADAMPYGIAIALATLLLLGWRHG